MILELGAGQADAVAKVFFELGWLEEGRGKDYLGHERVIRFSIKSHVK
jgi:methylase of polypeptide subunit release factors